MEGSMSRLDLKGLKKKNENKQTKKLEEAAFQTEDLNVQSQLELGLFPAVSREN